VIEVELLLNHPLRCRCRPVPYHVVEHVDELGHPVIEGPEPLHGGGGVGLFALGRLVDGGEKLVLRRGIGPDPV
jgi:hypothetical protein